MPFRFTALALLLLLLLPCLGSAKQGPPLAFRGIPFGTPLEEVPGLTPVASKITKGKQAFKDLFFREKEDLSFGEAQLRSIAYYFPAGKLRSVTIIVQGDANAFLVKDALIREYGQGRQVGSSYGWTWEEFSLVMKRQAEGEISVLTYTYEPRPATEK